MNKQRTRTIRWVLSALTLFSCWMARAAEQPANPAPTADLSARAIGSSPREAPRSGKEFWALSITGKALNVWDIELTQRRIRQSPTWREANPLLPRRPGRSRMYAQFLGGSLAADYLTWRLRRSGHVRWARALQVAGIGMSLWGIQQNARHR